MNWIEVEAAKTTTHVVSLMQHMNSGWARTIQFNLLTVTQLRGLRFIAAEAEAEAKRRKRVFAWMGEANKLSFCEKLNNLYVFI